MPLYSWPQIAALVSALVASSAAAFAWLCWQGAHHWAAYAPPAVYVALAALLFLPFNVVHRVRLCLGEVRCH